MDFLSYSLAAITAFSGLLAGVILAINAKEEMPTARKYFPLMQKIIFLAIIAVTLNFFKAGIEIKLIVYAAAILLLLSGKISNLYPILAVFFFMMGQESQSMFTVTALVFLYGLPAGSMIAIQGKKMRWKTVVTAALKRHWAFPAIAILLQILYYAFALKNFS